MAQLTSNSVTGITTVQNSTDVVNKQYADNYPLPSQTGNTGKYLTTTDGTNLSWDNISNYQEFDTPIVQSFTVPNHANLLFIEAVGAGAGGNAGQSSSQTAVRWVFRTSGYYASAVAFTAASYGNNNFIIASNNSSPVVLLSSTNGIMWSIRTHSSTNGNSNTSIYGNNIYLLANAGGQIISSTNTIIWTSRTTGTTTGINGLTFGNNIYVLCGDSALVRTSTDAIVWEARTSGLISIFKGVIFENVYNTYVIAGNNGNIITSTDAIVWQLRTSNNTTIAYNTLTFGNNIYVVGGNVAVVNQSGILRTSTDAIIWSVRTSGIPNNINSLVFANNTYVAGAGGGYISTSTDSIVWVLRTSNTSNNVLSLTSGNDVLVFTATFSVIATSYALALGTGGSSGSYTSWYIPKNIISSDLTIIPGTGGLGGTYDGEPGLPGTATTISWNGPAGSYTLVSNGGNSLGAPGIAQTVGNYFYKTDGLFGATEPLTGVGVNATSQINQYQPTGGGSGTLLPSSSGGNGGSITYYGNNIFASGGTPLSPNGSSATVISGLPYGYGGGGGGNGLIVGSGGNGSRGGGGGGGAVLGASIGTGGNGGNGYVKITWW